MTYCHQRLQIFSASYKVILVLHTYVSLPRISLRGRLQVTFEILRIHRSMRRSHPNNEIKRDLSHLQQNLACYISPIDCTIYHNPRHYRDGRLRPLPTTIYV